MPTSPANEERRPTESRQEGPIAEQEEPPGDDGIVDERVQLRAELSAAEDRHRRALADLDNFRKRVERDGDQRAEAARRALLGEWLEVRDSVERALQHEPEDPGLTAVLAQIDAILTRHGIAPMAAEGMPFDPRRFEAIAVRTNGEVPGGTVIAVARTGFEMADGDILRPAQVVVSKHTDAGTDGV